MRIRRFLFHIIRLTDRLGRGYVWEVLRAKLLYAQVAFREKKRPRFENKRERELRQQEAIRQVLADDAFGPQDRMYRVEPCYGLPPRPKMPSDTPKSTRKPKLLGPDISTLAKLLEDGAL